MARMRDIGIPARYPGTCPECGERWQAGDQITTATSGQWRHAVCPEPTDPTDLKPGETACDRCWLIHPEGACDR